MPTTQASEKAAEKDDKATSTAAPELEAREHVPGDAEKADKEADRRKAEALRVLGFPEREAKSVREDDGAVIVEHRHGAQYRVESDGTVKSLSGEGENRRRHEHVINNGADVPPQVVEASSVDADGSDDLPLDLDAETHAKLAELTDPEEAAEAREKALAHAGTTSGDSGEASDRPESATKATNADETSGGAATRGTTDAARARKS